MGLDVYLYRYDDKAKSDALKAEWDRRSDEIYARKLEDDECDRALNALYEELGVNEAGEDVGTHEIREPSKLAPEHPFNVGCFFSSYNEGGLNAIVRRQLGVEGLYEVFPESAANEYYFQPDWAGAKQRAEQLASALSDKVQANPLDVVEARWNMFVAPEALPGNAHAALEVFFATQRRNHGSEHNYGTRDGEFFPHTPMTVRALIPGTCKRLFGEGLEPRLYAIVERPAEHFAWYVTALRIVAETCDYVLRQPDSHKYWLRWSA